MIWVWTEVQLPPYHKNVIAKQLQLNPSQVFILNTFEQKDEFLLNLKTIAQACFEVSRSFYRQLGDKYKLRMSSSAMSAKFMQPWMQTIYYSFKMAFLEELKGELALSLKFYHSILAKYKQMIEGSKNTPESLLQIINYLRSSSEVGFLKV
jgi:hypothetical protein